MQDMNDIRCVSCSGETGVQVVADELDTFRCADCGIVYESAWGVPFFGRFEQEDVPGLIEIAANISNRGRFGITPAVVEDWERLLAAYDQAEDKAAFKASNPDAQSPYFLNRYGEWTEVTHLTRDLDLHGRKVLDMGAGLGFDSHRLSMRGANVTALEFSPVLAESGQASFPNIRWIGGLSHYLPFKNQSFDAVFCNAALHHMRDIPATIFEALRVLRPGGMLITTCDSFRPSASGDEAELEIFDREPAVLMGVNEGVPRFSDFVSMLQQHADLLEIDIYTHTLYGPIRTLTELMRWDLASDGKMLANRNGSLALRVRLKEVWPEPARIQSDAVLSAKEYASWLSTESSAIAKLAQLMPSHYIDLPFPGGRGSKFELLNGWRLQKSFQQARTACRRGRWFLRRTATTDALLFEVGLPAADTGNTVASISVMLDGELCGDYQVAPSSWVRVKIDLSNVPVGRTFAVEIRKQGDGATLDEGAFVVRNRRCVTTHSIAGRSQDINMLAARQPTVFAVIPVFNRLHFTRECIAHLKAQTYRPIRIVVADGGSTDGTIEAIRTGHPDVTVLTTATELWWAGSMAMGIEHVLDASNDEGDCVLMMNNDTMIQDDYVETLVRASQAYDAAVGALVVDSRNPGLVLDAGEYIEWPSYSFPVKTSLDPDEQFCDDVDVLPGRGSLIPLKMIRQAGNVDARMLPHYLADYEFFYRLKQHGFKLGVCYETKILAHIEETGIVPSAATTGFAPVWRELFSRRSMSNVIDHWHFVGRHAPPEFRFEIRCRLMKRIVADLTLRTPLRPIFIPVYCVLHLPGRITGLARRQVFVFREFARAIRKQGIDVLCHPYGIPRLIRLPLYLVASPGPLRREDCIQLGLDTEDLQAQGVLRRVAEGWYALETLHVAKGSESFKLRLLFWSAWNPLRKIGNTLALRRTLMSKAGA